MKSASPPPGLPTPGPAAGIHEIERFLAAQTEFSRARQVAEVFADRMPRLTTTERQQLATLYTREHLKASHRLRTELVRQHAAHKAHDLLRRRCVAVALLIGAAGAGFAHFTLQALTTR
ncbi:hypothetical protein ACIQM3_23550 [Streptomyces sp. NPDC091271]|uniref:hypothetical protein n=1 Tax=Streptomyces sp. NPDC091271 TaxID=3365980 RepID=UPI00380F1517